MTETITHSLDEKKKRLAQKKQSIQMQEKLLKEQEKKKRAARFAEIGRLANAANIDHFDQTTLLGAFIELAEKLQNDSAKEKYTKNGHDFLKQQKEKDSIPMFITFKSTPNKEIKEKLKTLKFKWNSFRGEFYGYGNKKDIETLLTGYEYLLHFPVV